MKALRFLLACGALGLLAPCLARAASRSANSLPALEPLAHDLAPLRVAVTEIVEPALGDPSPGLAIRVIHGGGVI